MGFDGTRTGLGKAVRPLNGHRIPFGVQDADKGACSDSVVKKFGAGFVRACDGKIQRQPVGQNVQEPHLVIELAMAMNLCRDNGDEIVAVQPQAALDGLGGKARVGLVMV